MGKKPKEPCVYFIRQVDGGYIKIGITTNLRERLIQLQTANPKPLEIAHSIDCTDMQEAANIESFLHNKFMYSQVSGEWFNPDRLLLETINYLIEGGDIDSFFPASTFEEAIVGWGVWNKMCGPWNDLCRIGSDIMKEGDRRKIEFFISEVYDIIATVIRPYRKRI